MEQIKMVLKLILFQLIVINIAYADSRGSIKKMVIPTLLNNNEIVFGSTINEILKSHKSDFRPLKKNYFSLNSKKSGAPNPAAKLSDFNDDGVKDIVVFGFSDKDKMVYIYGIVSDLQNRTYNILTLESYPIEPDTFKENPFYLTLVKDKRIKKNKVDILQVESVGPGTTSVTPYYFSKSKKSFVLFQGVID